jgi:hypothetical protein
MQIVPLRSRLLVHPASNPCVFIFGAALAQFLVIVSSYWPLPVRENTWKGNVMRVPISLIAVAGLLAFITAAIAGSAGRCGGDGGNRSQNQTLTCPEGEYIAGIATKKRFGTRINQFNIVCQKFSVGGTLGTRGDYISVGPGDGRSEETGCVSGSAISAIHVQSGIDVQNGAYIDRVEGAVCSFRYGDQ